VRKSILFFKVSILLIFIFYPLRMIWADPNADAKTKYLAAEALYVDGKHGAAIGLLEEVIDILGESNLRVQCLLAKCCFARKDQYDDLRGAHEVERYFVLAPPGLENSEDFIEMVKLRAHFDKVFQEEGFTVKRFDIKNGEFSAAGFVWKIGPDDDTSFDEAQSWIKSLGKGWTAPDSEQLTKLRKEGKKLPFHNFKFSPLPIIMIWGTPKNSTEAFAIESMMGWYVEFDKTDNKDFRALAVRSAG